MGLCLSQCEGHSWNFQMYTALGPTSKLNTFLRVQSWEPDQKEARNRRHSASTVFPVNVAEATSAKQGDRQPCGPRTYAQSQR
jgi:hypothetical protein